MKRLIIFLLILLTTIQSYSTVIKKDLYLTKFPFTALKSDSTVTFNWVNILNSYNIPIDSSVVFAFSKTPGGNNINQYQNKISGNQYFSYNSSTPEFKFIPSTIKDQNNNQIMNVGVFYYVLYIKNIEGTDTTEYISNQLQMVIESKDPVTALSPITSSSDGISETVPVFSWEANPGVPYYHLILSDEPISIDPEGSNVSGISAIWQVITPATTIQYGTPDPSGEFSDIAPPPLSPGVTYNWLVLNNYGNTVYSSSTVTGAPVSFSIKGLNNVTKPINKLPIDNANLDFIKDSTITFSWQGGGINTNTYELYIFVTDSVNGVEAKVNIWKTTTTDTFFVFNAQKTLYNKEYFWKVYALNSEGTGKVSEFTSFKYNINVAYLNTKTYTIINNEKHSLPYVSIKATPITGSADIIPFGTNADGVGATRPFLPGKYKLTASKDKYITQESIIDMSEIEHVYEKDFTLSPAPAIAYGKIMDNNNIGIGEVNIVANGPNNEQVNTKTDNSGNYTIDITTEGQWTILATKTGYEDPLPVTFTIENGDAKKLEDINMEKANFQIFGKILNSSSLPIKRVLVEVLDDKDVVYDFNNTADNGTFNFFVPYGAWKIKASLDGFATQEKNIQDLAQTNEINITLKEAGQISGTIYRTDFLIDEQIYGQPSQYSNAKVYAINTTTNDTISTTTDLFGKYSFGVNYGSYKIIAKAENFIQGEYKNIISISNTKRSIASIDIIITGYGDIKGSVRSNIDSLGIGNATIIVKDTNNKIIKTEHSDSNGNYTINNLADGNYLVSSAKLGYKSSSAINIEIDSGKVNNSPTFYLDKGKIYRLNIFPISNNKYNTSPIISIIDPINIPIKLKNNKYSLDSLVAGTYTINLIANTTPYIDCQQTLTINDNPIDSIINDSISLSITHTPKDTIQFNDDGSTITLHCTVLNSGSYKATLFYKIINETEYKSSTLNLNNKEFTSNVALNTGDTYLDYYFEIKDINNKIIYSNKNNPFFSYIKPIIKMQYIAFNPTYPDTSNTKYLLTNMEYPISIDAYYKGKIYNNILSEVKWLSSDDSIINFEKKFTKDNETNKLYTLKSSTKPVYITAIAKGKYGETDTIQTKIMVINGKIDSVYISRQDIKVDNKIIANNEIGIFKVFGLISQNDSSKITLEIPALWSISPNKSATIENNFLTIKKDFVGQIILSATIQNYGSITYNDNKAIRYKNRFLHVQSKITPPDTVSDYKNLKIIFPDSSFINEDNDKLNLSNEIVTNNQRIVDKYEIMGDIYNFSMKNSNIFNNPLNFKFKIPKDFISRKQFALGLYNDSLLSFKIIDTNMIISDDSTLTAKIKHFSTYAFFATREPLKIKNVELTPNPFSPFVYARDNNKKYPGIGIKFYCSSQYDPVPSIKIEIFTIKGVKVWERKDSPAPTSGYQDFHWDGKYMSTDKYVRNGRYIIKITARELTTGVVNEYKNVIVLIK